MLAWFDEFQTLPLPHKVWLQCQLALIEGFTNAIRHAHAHLPPQTPICIEVQVCDSTVDIRIWDFGPGFDLDSVLAHKLAFNDTNAEGGRGLRIMHLVADTLSYERTPDQRNCLHIHKVYGDEGEDQGIFRP